MASQSNRPNGFSKTRKWTSVKILIMGGMVIDLLGIASLRTGYNLGK